MIQNIFFFSEETDFKLESDETFQKWVSQIVEDEDAEIENINFIFCNDEFLLNINKQYLNHDYYTDIISFPFSELPDPLTGDIFISIDRVKENAQRLGLSFEDELVRVMAHGVLHFLGYKDKSEEESAMMRKKEDEKISLYRLM